jgi:hypothetical protein
MIQYQRDTTIEQLEHNVFSQIKELCKDDPIYVKEKNKTKFVSCEDAIKELYEIKKSEGKN